MKPHTRETQENTTPELALQYLREGNERFVSNKGRDRNLLEQVHKTSDEQFPIAVTLSCIDSRTACELIFDQGIGHIFSIRLAGGIINEDVLGSMEFACKFAGSKLIVVLGHTKCGAVQAACDNLETGNLSTLLNKIQPSVYLEKTVTENRSSENSEFVEKVARIQVKRNVEKIIERSSTLREMIEQGKIGLIGAVYDVDTGQVEFLEETFISGELKHFYLDVNGDEETGKASAV